MLESLNKIIINVPALQRDLSRYELSGVTNLTALSRIKKAFLAAAEHIKTEHNLIDCKTGFYGSMQKMRRLGIDLNDTDLWFINQYKGEIKAEYMYQALLRSAAKRGLMCLPIFEFILPQEKFSTYYTENGRILIDYRDEGLPKEVNLQNINTYKFFFLLLNVKKDGKLIHQEKVSLTPADILKHKNMSKTKDRGEMVKRWNKDTNRYESVEKDTQSVWEQWTAQMIKKTLVLQAFSILKHVLPDLGEIFEFDDLEEGDIAMTTPSEQEKPFVPEKNDIDNPSETVINEAKKLEEEYRITPELIDYNKHRILEGISICQNQEQVDILISREAATIISIGNDFMQQVKNACQAVSAI